MILLGFSGLRVRRCAEPCEVLTFCGERLLVTLLPPRRLIAKSGLKDPRGPWWITVLIIPFPIIGLGGPPYTGMIIVWLCLGGVLMLTRLLLALLLMRLEPLITPLLVGAGL